MKITSLFVEVDDFLKNHCWLWEIEQQVLMTNNPQKPKKRRNRQGKMSLSERCTILILFHESGFRTFKQFYLSHVCHQLRGEFPNLLSYNRFVELIPDTLLPLSFFLKSMMASCSGISFIDSTKIPVCHVKRANSHRVFKGLACLSKSTTGWYFGFKLHLVVNDKGELLAFELTAANVDDRKPVSDLTKKLFGRLYGDKGYISQSLFEQLFARGLWMVTNLRKNMKNKLMSEFDKCMLRKRAIIESVNDQLKNISQIEHSRHRSLMNFVVNLVCGLISYQRKPKKPSLSLEINAQVPAVVTL